MMMENALTHILQKEYKLTNQEIQGLYGAIEALCIGYAFDPKHIKELAFKKIIIFSAYDNGVLIPMHLFNYIINTLGQEEKYKIYCLEDHIDKKLTLFLLSDSSIPKSTPYDLDHSIPYYLRSIQALPEEIQECIGASLSEYYIDYQ
jgi:hypothetical protein